MNTPSCGSGGIRQARIFDDQTGWLNDGTPGKPLGDINTFFGQRSNCVHSVLGYPGGNSVAVKGRPRKLSNVTVRADHYRTANQVPAGTARKPRNSGAEKSIADPRMRAPIVTGLYFILRRQVREKKEFVRHVFISESIVEKHKWGFPVGVGRAWAAFAANGYWSRPKFGTYEINERSQSEFPLLPGLSENLGIGLEASPCDACRVSPRSRSAERSSWGPEVIFGSPRLWWHPKTAHSRRSYRPSAFGSKPFFSNTRGRAAHGRQVGTT